MKPVCILQGPVATRSGYGDATRDIASHLIDLDIFDLKIISLPWGATPMNALDGNNSKHVEILKRISSGPIQVQSQPELFIQVTIPNEFMQPAKTNIGITAGIESNMCSEQWLHSCNKMNVVFGMSAHAANSILNTIVHKKDQAGNLVEEVKLKVPMDVLHNCVHTDVFKKISSSEVLEPINDLFLPVKENFCFLFVGHWLRGNLGEDRKNVGMLVKTFCETFKNIPSSNRPALILKTSGADFSLLDREEILNKINIIKNSIGAGCPNVYIIHGDLTVEEMNSLYNHPKVKAHVSFTKGEGFGRPLLEASMSEKPIIASGWSGHLDFLNPTDSILLSGELRPIEAGSVWENVLIPQSSWFNINPEFASKAMMLVYKDYDRFLPGARKLAKDNRDKFSYDAIKTQFHNLLKKYVPSEVMNPPKLVPINLANSKFKVPALKKLGESTPEKPTESPKLIKKLGQSLGEKV